MAGNICDSFTFIVSNCYSKMDELASWQYNSNMDIILIKKYW